MTEIDKKKQIIQILIVTCIVVIIGTGIGMYAYGLHLVNQEYAKLRKTIIENKDFKKIKDSIELALMENSSNILITNGEFLSVAERNVKTLSELKKITFRYKTLTFDGKINNSSNQYAFISSCVYPMDKNLKKYSFITINWDCEPHVPSIEYHLAIKWYLISLGQFKPDYLKKIADIFKYLNRKTPLGVCFIKNEGYLFTLKKSEYVVEEVIKFDGIDGYVTPIEAFCYFLRINSYDVND